MFLNMHVKIIFLFLFLNGLTGIHAAEMKEAHAHQMAQLNSDFSEIEKKRTVDRLVRKHTYGEEQGAIQRRISRHPRGTTKDWKNYKRLVMDAVIKHRIHPDDMGYFAPIAESVCSDDDSFARFLLAHDASPFQGIDCDRSLLRSAKTVPVALALIAHGANPCHSDRLGKKICLHRIPYCSQAPRLALLYYMAGADPLAVDDNGRTPLIRIAYDVAQGKMSYTMPKEFIGLVELAEMLVRIGVPLDTCVTKDCGEPGSYDGGCCHEGDNVWRVLFEGRTHRPTEPGIQYLENRLRAAHQEVRQTNDMMHGKKEMVTRGALPQLPPPVVSIVVEYVGKEHELPRSVLADLRQLRQEVDLFKSQYDAERKKEAEEAAREWIP